MILADELEAIAGMVRTLKLELQPGEHAAHMYAAYFIDDALCDLEDAVRHLREGETLKTAEAFGVERGEGTCKS